MAATSSERRSLLRDWRLWVSVFAVFYVVFGFVGVPRIIESLLVGKCKEGLDRVASVEEVSFNPFTLTVDIRGFTLQDPDGERLASFDQFVYNASWTSLIHWASVVDELKIVGPSLRIRMLPDGRLSIADLLEKAEANVGDDAGPPRAVLKLLRLSDGSFEFIDQTREPRYELKFADLDLEVRHLSTIDRDAGAHDIGIRFDEDTILRWSGSLDVNPLVLDGRFELEGLSVPRVWEYFGDGRPFDLPTGNVNAAFTYHVERTGQKEVRAELSDGSVAVGGPSLVDRSSGETWLEAANVSVSGISARFPERQVNVESCVVDGTTLKTFFDEDGFNWKRILPGHEESEEEAAPSFELGVNTIELRDASATITNLRRSLDATVALSDGHVTLTGLTYPERAPARVDLDARVGAEGHLLGEGTASLKSRSAEVRVSASDVSLIEHIALLPRLRVGRLAEGKARCDGHLILDASTGFKVSFKGQAGLSGVEILSQDGERLLAVDDLDAGGVAVDFRPLAVRMASVLASKAFVKVRIDSEGVTNFERKALSSIAKSEETIADTAKVPIDIALVEFSEGSVDFADLSLIIPFAAHVTSLNGSVKGLSSTAVSGARVELEGNVEDDGFAKVDGTTRPFEPFAETELRVLFRNVDMPTLTPYSAEFAGYAIEGGRLDLDVRYVIRERQLHADHNLLARDLVLGERVEGTRGLGVPLKLAVELLKDKNGKIDMDVALDGSVDDPEFNYRRLMWAALRKILVNVASKPFTFIGDLLGVSGDELDRVAFESGTSRLLPPEDRQVADVVRVLRDRDSIRVEVTPVWDGLSDADAIRRAKLEAAIDARRTRLGSDASTDQVLESLFLEANGREAMEGVKARHTKQTEGEETSFDAPGYYVELRAALKAGQVVDPSELLNLAAERAKSIATAFTGADGIEMSRVTILDAVEVPAKERGAELVYCRLSLSAD